MLTHKPTQQQSIQRIVHVTKIIRVAGMERHLLSLLPGLKACGLDVRLIVLINPGQPMDDYAAEMQRLGIPTEQIVIQRHIDPALIGKLNAKFRALNVDAVHTHLIHADLYGQIAAKLAGVRYTFFSGHNDDRFRKFLPVRLLQGVLWRAVTAGIVISESLRKFVVSVEFAPPAKVHTIHYGLDPSSITFDPQAREKLTAELGLPNNALIIGSLCRLTAQKGLTYALEGFKQVASEFPNAHYIIAGEGELLPSLLAQVEQSGLTGRVHFLGWRPDARSLLPAFNVLLMPSLWEGFGLTLLEAMAASVPIIASAVSAMPEVVINGRTGYLIPPTDPDAIAEKLRVILRDPVQSKTLGIAGRQRLEQVFSVSRMVETTLNVYQDQ